MRLRIPYVLLKGLSTGLALVVTCPVAASLPPVFS